MKLLSLFRQIRQNFEPANIKHTLLNWSQSELGLRHPDNPCGMVLRDQFQAELFAGRTRSILSGDGVAFHQADVFAVASKFVNLMTQDIQSLRLNHKYFNPIIFSGRNVLLAKDDIDYRSKYIVTSSTYVQNDDGSTGRLIGTEPLSSVLDFGSIFLSDDNDPLPSPHVEIHNLFKGVL